MNFSHKRSLLMKYVPLGRELSKDYSSSNHTASNLRSDNSGKPDPGFGTIANEVSVLSQNLSEYQWPDDALDYTAVIDRFCLVSGTGVTR